MDWSHVKGNKVIIEFPQFIINEQESLHTSKSQRDYNMYVAFTLYFISLAMNLIYNSW